MQNQMKNSKNVLLLGGVVLDRYYEVDHYPEAGQDTLIHKFYDRVGGCTLNVAMTLNNLGSRPYIVNKMGDDEIGVMIEMYLQTMSIPTDYMMIAPGKQTGYCLNILDRSGERTFFTYKGCEMEFSLDEFPCVFSKDFAIAYITGYYLLNPQTTSNVMELVSRLRQNGCQILFDPGPLVGEMDCAQLHSLLMLSNWIIPNTNELMILQNKLGIHQDFASWFVEKSGGSLVIKKGSEGVDIFTSESSISVKGFPIKPKDTTGAGDSFAGGFIHALINSNSLKETARLANACGAFTATIEGPHGVFSLDDIYHFMKPFEENNL
jgi:sugar/nucleoside kinase (ribokinase family)